MADAAQAVSDKAAAKKAAKQALPVVAPALLSTTGAANTDRRTTQPSVTQKLSNDNKADKQEQTAANKSKKDETAKQPHRFSIAGYCMCAPVPHAFRTSNT